MKGSELLVNGMALALVVIVSGCVTPPQYDDQTDKLITQLQTDVDTGIVALITVDHKIDALAKKTDPVSQKALSDAKTKAAYDANTSFYDKVDVDLTSLQTRVDAEPTRATPFLDKGLKDLRDNLLAADGSLQATHEKADILSVAYLQGAQQTIDAQIEALLTRELGLKGNGSTGSSDSSSGSNAAKASTSSKTSK